jgi:hypothetical protein
VVIVEDAMAGHESRLRVQVWTFVPIVAHLVHVPRVVGILQQRVIERASPRLGDVR